MVKNLTLSCSRKEVIGVLFGTDMDKDIAGLTEHKGCVLIKQRIGRIKREDEKQNK